MAFAIRQLTTEEELLAFASIASRAYPGFGRGEEEIAQGVRELESEETNSFWGCYEGNHLLGGMRILDLSLNYSGKFIPAGGLGYVAVGLPSKKRGVARDMVRFFLDYCRHHGMGMSLLYPFRPDFYHRMGFGFGQEGRMFALAPERVPYHSLAPKVRSLGEEDLEALADCYHDFARSRHGYCCKTEREIKALLKTQGLYGYPRSGPLEGYLAFDFARAHDTNALKHDLIIREWVWHHPRAFSELASFLHSQRDQVHRISFSTQQPDFHFLSPDPRNPTDNMFNKHYHECYTGGVGLMYRITSLPLLLDAIAHRNFNDLDCRLNLEVEDSFCPQETGSYQLLFQGGRVSLDDHPEEGIAVSLDVAELSSLLMGSVEFSTLYRLGKVKVDPDAVSLLSHLFWCQQRPECVTSF